MTTDHRRDALIDWLTSLGHTPTDFRPASADASVRRYFRFSTDETTLIAVDTPQSVDENQAFIDVATRLEQAGLHPPQIHASDPVAGWMLLEDFGDQTFAIAVAHSENPIALYTRAAENINTQQNKASTQGLPQYSPAMIATELAIFIDWCLSAQCEITLSHSDKAVWAALGTTLTDAFAEQPQVFCHRDFHGRNLMMIDGENIGLIDFQGAVRGPLYYDWASLLRDCYHRLKPAHHDQLFEQFHRRATTSGLCTLDTPSARRLYDLTGMQRHLKAIGIFCRLDKRDGKSAYLADIPRTLGYVLAVCDRYPELAAFRALCQKHQLTERLSC